VKFVAFGVCGILWRFVAFCGFLWLFVANRMRWVVPGKLKFFVKSFGRDHLIVSNEKTGKCHFVAAAAGAVIAAAHRTTLYHHP
jgi:hypothetical protein